MNSALKFEHLNVHNLLIHRPCLSSHILSDWRLFTLYDLTIIRFLWCSLTFHHVVRQSYLHYVDMIEQEEVLNVCK